MADNKGVNTSDAQNSGQTNAVGNPPQSIPPVRPNKSITYTVAVVGFLLLAFFGAIIAYKGRGGTTGDMIIEITGLGKGEFNQSSVGWAMIIVSAVAVVYLLTKPPPSVLPFNKTQYSFAERLGQWRGVILLIGMLLAAIILVFAYR